MLQRLIPLVFMEPTQNFVFLTSPQHQFFDSTKSCQEFPMSEFGQNFKLNKHFPLIFASNVALESFSNDNWLWNSPKTYLIKYVQLCRFQASATFSNSASAVGFVAFKGLKSNFCVLGPKKQPKTQNSISDFLKSKKMLYRNFDF